MVQNGNIKKDENGKKTCNVIAMSEFVRYI